MGYSFLNWAFDLCSACNLLAHDYGLYDVKDRLNRMGYKPSHNEEFYNGLAEEARCMYDYLASQIESGKKPIKSRYL